VAYLTTTHKTQEEWLIARRKGIGASESSIILKQSRFTSPVALWARKKGIWEESQNDDSLMLFFGHKLEPFASDLFEKESGIEVDDPGEYTIYTSGERSHVFATPDRVTKSGEPVEIKTAWGDQATRWGESIPLAYQIQIQHQIYCLDSDHAYAAALIFSGFGPVFKWYRVDRHQGFIDRMLHHVDRFWEDFVVANKQPPVDGHEATTEALGYVYPEDNGQSIDLKEDAQEMAESYLDEVAKLKKHTEQKRLHGNRLREVLGENQAGILVGFKITNKENCNGQKRLLVKRKVAK
jgi:putative phage-type endonuclease